VSEPGALLVRYQVDPRDELWLARLRLACIALAIPGAGLVLLGEVPIPVFMAALLALLISLVWHRQAKKALLRSKAPDRFYLAIHEHGFWLSEGEAPQFVPFSDVRDIAIDEEHLDIVVSRDQDTIRIEPRYPGVAIHALMDRLRSAWLVTRDR
jgi:hypothetical protein